jgi:hypothetical protein
MGLNPRDVKRSGKIPSMPEFSKGGKPGIIITPLQMIEVEAKANSVYTKPLRPLPATNERTLKLIEQGKREYYIELWRLGDDPGAVECSTFDSFDVQHTLNLINKIDGVNIVYVRREVDQKVIFNRRVRV